ncbi:MAG: hypothetical protein MJZ68_01100 [archaeon]|nr:hypothetical protein [archaeon]
MRMDNRGDAGFFEAMAGTMAVCLVMTSFLAFMATEVSNTGQGSVEFDWTVMAGLTVSESGSEWSDDGTEYFVEANRLSGAKVVCSSPGLPIEERTWTCGEETPTTSMVKKVYSLGYGEQSVPTVVEVVLYRR